MTHLSILIVGYGNNHLLIDCVSSFYEELKEYNYINFEVVIVENNSKTISAPTYFNNKPEIKWIKAPYNSGYGRGNNLAFQNSEGEVILVMNPDIKITADGIQKLYANCKKEKKVSSCKLIYPNGDIQINYYPKINHLSALINQNLILKKLNIELREKKNTNIIGFTGAIFMFNKDIITSRFIFNPIYFMYEEENDFFYRMNKKGVLIELHEQVIAIHKTEGTIIDKDWIIKQKMVSKFQFIRNIYGVPYYLLYVFIKTFNLIFLLLLAPFVKDKSLIKNELLVNFKIYRYFLLLIYRPSLFIKLTK